MTTQMVSGSLEAVRALLTRRVLIDFDRIPFEFRDVPPGKLLNWVLAKWSMHLRLPRPWAWPTHLQVEPSSLCNLRCAFCPVTTGLQRPTGLMDLGVFKKALTELGDYLLLINLWNWGEPFLNPAVYDMIAFARQRGVKVISSTNGHHFAHDGTAVCTIRGASTAGEGADVELFNDEGEQGAYYRGTCKVAADGAWAFTGSFYALNITGTVTTPSGYTSEFASFWKLPPPRPDRRGRGQILQRVGGNRGDGPQ